MDLDEDPDIQLDIPIRPIHDELCCPICFNPIKDCYMTHCGHNFCAGCIFECINRKHSCPCCNRTTVKENLVKNHHFDKLLNIVVKHKEDSSKKYFESIINARLEGVPNEPQAPRAPDERGGQLSPIEALFHKHLKKSLVTYEDYYKDLTAHYETMRLKLQNEYTNKMVATPAQKDVLAVECASRVDECDRGLKRATDLLLEVYDTYLKDVAPSPENLPVILSLVVPSRGIRVNDLLLKSSNTLSDIRLELERSVKGRGDNIIAWSPNNSFVLKRGTGSDDILLKEENKPISYWRFPPGSEVHVLGDIQLASDQPPECFTVTFTRSPPPTICDYYTCKDCKFNWICKSCATTCHKGHSIAVYILGHQSTWACCYCPKNHKCKILNNKSK